MYTHLSLRLANTEQGDVVGLGPSRPPSYSLLLTNSLMSFTVLPKVQSPLFAFSITLLLYTVPFYRSSCSDLSGNIPWSTYASAYSCCPMSCLIVTAISWQLTANSLLRRVSCHLRVTSIFERRDSFCCCSAVQPNEDEPMVAGNPGLMSCQNLIGTIAEDAFMSLFPLYLVLSFARDKRGGHHMT